MAEHKHRWKKWATTGFSGKKGKTFILERCACKEGRERRATEAERLKIHANYLRFERRGRLMHVAWRPVQGLLKKYAAANTQGAKWQFMKAMGQLQKKYPDYIRYVRVDDDCHANSDLWFVSHKYDDKAVGRGYWGTSVVYIGQCSDDAPVSFFCYPGHMRNLRALTEQLDKESRRMNRGQKDGKF